MLFGIFMGLEATANVLAMEQYFSDEPQNVMLINQESRQDQQDQQDRHEQHEWQDENDQRADHPTGQPAPR